MLINISIHEEKGKFYLDLIRKKANSGYYPLDKAIRCCKCNHLLDGISRYQSVPGSVLFPGFDKKKIYNMIGNYYGTIDETIPKEDYYDDEEDDGNQDDDYYDD